MILHGPSARSATHQDAGQQYTITPAGSAPDGVRQPQSRRGHDHLKTVLHVALAVEEQDILSASAYVYSQNQHCLNPDLFR